jgi:hypothetical protein
MIALFGRLVLAAAAGTALLAQTVCVPVNAPYAQELVFATKAAHREPQKLGLHEIIRDELARQISTYDRLFQ